MFKRRLLRQGVRVLTAAVFAVSLTAVCQAAPKKIILKAITAWPKTVYESQNFLKFIDMVNQNAAKKYPGELEIQYLGGPEVIPNREQVEACEMVWWIWYSPPTAIMFPRCPWSMP